MAESEEITYRLSTEKDIPGLLSLWGGETEWGNLSEETWRSWYVDTPYGPCIVPIALRGDEIVGQLVMTPVRVSLCDPSGAFHEVKALRLSAPVLRRELRRKILRRADHPVISLLSTGTGSARDAGYAVVYAMPEHSWLPFFKWLNSDPRLPQFANAAYQCVSAPLAPGLYECGEEESAFVVRRETTFTAEFTVLQRPPRIGHSVSVARHPEWLAYKHAANIVLVVRRRGSEKLVGYVAIKPGSGLIVDFVSAYAHDEAPALRAVLQFLVTEAGALLLPDTLELKAMETPTLGPILRTLGFADVDYKFAFVCQTISESVPKESIAPECWYILPGD